jgi:mRNA interferase YafQ
MREIERSTAFKRDLKRVLASPRHRNDAVGLLEGVLSVLLEDRPLPDGNRDHALSGDWAGYRECHVKPDLLLIYKKPDDAILRLARLGSHSELFRWPHSSASAIILDSTARDRFAWRGVSRFFWCHLAMVGRSRSSYQDHSAPGHWGPA